MKKIDLLEVHENLEEWNVENKSSSAYRLLNYISQNEGMYVGEHTFKNLCEHYNPGMIGNLFNSLVEKELIFEDYVSPRDRGWFLSEKGKKIAPSDS